jgi:hypothetical protein
VTAHPGEAAQKPQRAPVARRPEMPPVKVEGEEADKAAEGVRHV